MKNIKILLLITGILVAGIAFNTVAQLNPVAVKTEKKKLVFKHEKNKDKNKNKIKDKNKDKNKNKNKEYKHKLKHDKIKPEKKARLAYNNAN